MTKKKEITKEYPTPILKSERVTYVLEVSWSWDNSHYEFGTIAVEAYEMPDGAFENLLDPNFPSHRKSLLMERLRNLFLALDRSIMGKGEMMRLYRVIDPTIMISRMAKAGNKNPVELKLTLLPICDFNKDGPVEIKQ